ncbi:hypothetical protein EDD85DRAFT_957439 [Armillaria nabsnona]|nr:hypothetical protein EDD85DRAFT_957439 [Armillaria nabsnona]
MPFVSSLGRGMRVLFEFAFCNRYSPTQFLFPMRYTEPPYKIKDMSKMDVGSISASIILLDFTAADVLYNLIITTAYTLVLSLTIFQTHPPTELHSTRRQCDAGLMVTWSS